MVSHTERLSAKETVPAGHRHVAPGRTHLLRRRPLQSRRLVRIGPRYGWTFARSARRAVLLLLVLGPNLSSCRGGDTSSGPTMPLAREYSGALTYTHPAGLSRTLRFSLPATSGAVTGRYAIVDVTTTEDAGTLRGSISETVFTLSGASQITAGLFCDFSGQVTGTATVLTGRMTCSDGRAASFDAAQKGVPTLH